MDKLEIRFDEDLYPSYRRASVKFIHNHLKAYGLTNCTITYGTFSLGVSEAAVKVRDEEE